MPSFTLIPQVHAKQAAKKAAKGKEKAATAKQVKQARHLVGALVSAPSCTVMAAKGASLTAGAPANQSRSPCPQGGAGGGKSKVAKASAVPQRKKEIIVPWWGHRAGVGKQQWVASHA